ncbi:MAG: hypothetical protein HOV94_07290 [Saccharothrix sp.]|nr:hypothetical protein [Saccharothrix sp.]
MGSELGSSFVYVADEVFVRVIDELKVTDRAFDLDVDVGDGSPQSGDPLLSFLHCVGAQVAECGVEQLAPVIAEDVVGQEAVELVSYVVLPDPV